MDTEGRVLRAEFEDFHYVTVYTPNSSSGLKRLPFRKEWDVAFRDYLKELDSDKPVVCCGDLNVAHAPFDLARPKSNYNKTPGYTQDEIDGMTAHLNSGFVDTWRHANPYEVKYSWWSYRARDWDAADKGRRLAAVAVDNAAEVNRIAFEDLDAETEAEFRQKADFPFHIDHRPDAVVVQRCQQYLQAIQNCRVRLAFGECRLDQRACRRQCRQASCVRQRRRGESLDRFDRKGAEVFR